MEEERCQCPEDEISVNDLIVHGYNLSTSTHRVCGKVHYMFAGKQRGIGGFSRGANSESPKLEETRVEFKCEELYGDWYKCLNCQDTFLCNDTYTKINYCPHCGRLIIWE